LMKACARVAGAASTATAATATAVNLEIMKNIPRKNNLVKLDGPEPGVNPLRSKAGLRLCKGQKPPRLPLALATMQFPA
jgi:hypothetical protein